MAGWFLTSYVPCPAIAWQASAPPEGAGTLWLKDRRRSGAGFHVGSLIGPSLTCVLLPCNGAVGDLLAKEGGGACEGRITRMRPTRRHAVLLRSQHPAPNLAPGSVRAQISTMRHPSHHHVQPATV